MLATSAPSAAALRRVDDFPSLIAYLRDELDWDIPEVGYDQLTYSYTADELGLKLDAQIDIKQLRPILGQQHAWGVFFVDFDKAELPVTLLRRLLSGVSRKKRESANAGERALFGKNDLLFVSAYGRAEDRKLALAHFHQEPDTSALPTLRVVAWDRADTARHMDRVAVQLANLQWPEPGELPDAAARRWAQAFVDRPREAIRTSKEMAAALAEAAKTIRRAIEEVLPHEKPGEPLPRLYEAVKATLNKDLTSKKFADTYAQTLAYGLLAQRMDQVQRWTAEKARTSDGALPEPKITVEALETALPTNPFLSELLGSFLQAVGRDAGGARLDFDVLGVGDLVDLLNTANIEAVLADFDKDNAGDDPVIHFYEGFLAAYDKAMKVQRGVFYTPKPVVSFIVRSVDEVLQTEFGLKDGLADTTTWGEFVQAHPGVKIPAGVKSDEPFVKILDPATGTGTFLVEVVDLIWRRLTEETWKDKSKAEKARLWNAYVPRHLLPRLYGYELMMAPYAVAHMKIGLKLADTGYDFGGKGADGRPSRARVFLTNALEPAQDLDFQLAFMNEALAHEASAANDAKANTRFTAVIGNPPYSLESGNLTDENKEIIDRYRYVDGVRIRERAALQFEKVLNDDYVKFFAFAEDQIKVTALGVIGLITSHAFLDSLFLRGMRQSLIGSFPKLLVVDLHGNSAKKEVSPQGTADANVFDIQQGVALTIARRSPEPTVAAIRADVWGERSRKYHLLDRSRIDGLSPRALTPSSPKYLLTERQAGVSDEYETFEALDLIFVQYGAGYITARDNLVLDLDRDQLRRRISDFRDSKKDDKALLQEFEVSDKKGWSVSKARAQVKELTLGRWIRSALYRPFDFRWLFYHESLVWGRSWPTMKHLVNVQGNVGLITTKVTKDRWDIGCTRTVTANKSVSAYDTSSVFPLLLERDSGEKHHRPNLASPFPVRLTGVTGLSFVSNVERGDLLVTFGPRDVFDWIYAVLHSPEYRTRYADFLKSDFARVPLPKDCALFAELVPLGTRLVALHLLNPDAAPELLDPKVKWSRGKGEARLGAWGEGKDVRRDPLSGRVYINADHWFATVPQAAWEHWIGGYQPAQKWLKDRSRAGGKKAKEGRVLSADDILHYRRMIVSLERTSELQREIDAVIARQGGWPDACKGMTD